VSSTTGESTDTYICDTVVFITNFVERLQKARQRARLITTPEVEAEVKDVHTQYVLSSAIGYGLEISSADPSFIKQVRDAAEHSGDAMVLSDADISLLAKALEVKKTELLEDENLKIVTDDYDIQNMCLKLGILFMPLIQEGVHNVKNWTYWCPACKRRWEKGGNCPVCGTLLTTKRIR